MSGEIECIFCGLLCDMWEIDSHIKQCSEGVAVSQIIGENNMLLDRSVIEQGPVTSHPFIKARNISGKSVDAKVVAFRKADASMPYSDYLLDMQIGKTTFSLGLRERGEDMIRLANSFGLDTDRWIGKTITCYKEDFTSTKGRKSEIVRVTATKK